VTHNARDFVDIPGLKLNSEVEPQKPLQTGGLFENSPNKK
jgi:hypothetical protein